MKIYYFLIKNVNAPLVFSCIARFRHWIRARNKIPIKLEESLESAMDR